MATKFQIKRTSVSGRTPNTADPANTSYISAGELAVNLTDEKLFSSNGTVSFEVGSNLTSLAVTTVYANGATGTDGQVLSSNSSGGVYWANSLDSISTITTYTYSITSNTTVIEGADDNAAVLSYTAGRECVFLNGSKLILTDDFSETNSAAITLTSNAINGDVIEIVSISTTSFATDLTYPVDYSSSDTNILTIDSYNSSTYRTAKYLVQANTSDSFQSSEAVVIHDGTTAYIAEYGIAYSNGSLYTLSADINSGNVRLRATPTRSGTIFKSKRIILEV